jgi:hypothetical protein
MNLKTFVTCIAAAAATLLPAAVCASVTPVDLPAGVVSVDPPQGLVDLSNNANPLGVTQISVVFESSNLEPNPNAQGDVVMYKDAADAIYDSVPASSATVDQYTHQFGSIIFEHNHTAVGTYSISIPKGTWLVDGEESPEIGLVYEIENTTTITPAAGIVDKLDKVTIQFNNADAVSLRINNIVASAAGSADDCKVDVSVDGNVVELAISNYDGSELAPSTYTIFIPAKTFKLTTNGVDDYNTDILLQYVIPAVPKPEISPAEGEVNGFKEFTLTPAEDFELWMVDDKTRSYIYAVNADGTLAADASYKLLASLSEGKVVLKVLDDSWQAVEEPVVPTPGRYALVLANALLSGSYNNDFVSSAAFTYYYDVVATTTGITVVKVESTPIGDVYNLSGVKVAHGADQMRQLPAGVYIVNGIKVVKR